MQAAWHCMEVMMEARPWHRTACTMHLQIIDGTRHLLSMADTLPAHGSKTG